MNGGSTDSSATGPCEVSDAKLVPAGEQLGRFLREGNIAGDFAGVAEVEGTLAPADGTSAVAGTGELAGLPDGDDAGGDTAGAFTREKPQVLLEESLEMEKEPGMHEGWPEKLWAQEFLRGKGKGVKKPAR